MPLFVSVYHFNCTSVVTPSVLLLSNGRPRKLDAQDEHACVRTVTSGQIQTATKVVKHLKESIGIDATRRKSLSGIEKKQCNKSVAFKRSRVAHE